MPRRDDVPSTIQRSEQHAQDLWSAALDSAIESYGAGERAHRTAFAALKRGYEKVGDHWEPKDESGPSDDRAEQGGPDGPGESAGGVDANASKKHLIELATRLDVSGRSRMTKAELVDALQRENTRRTRAAAASD